MSRTVSVVLLLALAGCPPKAPVEPIHTVDPLAETLPVDPGVRSGVLPNGLTWYVEVNREPAARAVLRLAVDAGSVLEDDDQLGLAHFVEHMAFNGTENFPGNELITYLEGVGTQFGPHLNAHTNFDETVYKLTVPTDDAEVFEKGFLVLADWAGRLSFDDAEIDKERGVVLEEWRTRLGPGQRLFDKTLPATYFGSPYPDRLPIGTQASLEGFEADAVRRFYADWYRPELMAVIAVGDFDPDQVQAWIEAQFSDLPASTDPRERIRPTIAAHDDVKHVILADPEFPRATVNVMAKEDMPEGSTHGDYRDSLMSQVAFAIVNERLSEIARQPEAPFLGAGAGRRKLNPTEGAWVLGIATTDEGILGGYETVLTEVERLQRHGVRPGELERAKASVLKGYDRLEREQAKTDSVTHAREITRVYLTGEPMPGVAYEVELAKRYVPGFDVAEVSGWLRQSWMPDTSRVVTVSLPQRDGLAAPAEADLVAVETRVAASTIDALPEEAAVGELLTEAPTPGSIVETDETHVADLGFTGWTLSNGVQVWFRRTDFKEDEIRFVGYRRGGMSRVTEADYVSGALATEVVGRSGFGAHDADAMSRWSAGRTVGVRYAMSETLDQVSGNASVADAEALMQWLYAGGVAPRISEEGFARTLAQRTAGLRNRLQSPDTHFYDAYNALVWPSDPRRQPWTVETLEAASLDGVDRIYRDHFADATGFTYVFVGNLPEDFEGLVTQYLASLPTVDREVGHLDRGVRPEAGILEDEVQRGIEPKARVRLVYHGDFEDNTWERRNRLYAMTDILSVQLREELREDRGGVYGVSVRAREAYLPWDNYSVSIFFGCDPDRVEELISAAEVIVEDLRTSGPDASYVADEQEKNRRSREEDLRENGFWLNAFAGALQRGADPAELLTWDARNDSLTPQIVQDAAKEWLSGEDRVRVVLMPAVDEGG